MSKYSRGADRERELIRIAMASGAVLAIRGAGSKSHALEPELKVDLVVFKQGRVYLIQSKAQRKKNGKEMQRFYTAATKSSLHGKYVWVEAVFIESEEEMKELMER